MGWVCVYVGNTKQIEINAGYDDFQREQQQKLICTNKTQAEKHEIESLSLSLFLFRTKLKRIS